MPAARVTGNHGGDGRPVSGQVVDGVLHEDRRGRLRLKESQCDEVAVGHALGQLVNQGSGRPPRAETDLDAGVAAQEGVVLDQCHSAAEPRGRQRGGGSGHTPTDDHDIESPCVDRVVWQSRRRRRHG